MGPLVVLVHSPLVGSLTWARVAEELAMRGFDAVTPPLEQDERSPEPYWRQHARSVAQALEPVPTDRRLILVGHSGAGQLLPSITHESRRPVAAYIFVDAGIPQDGQSRLAPLENDGLAQDLRKLYASGRRFPHWSDEDLKDAIPNTDVRRRVLAELQPQPWRFWAESIPVFSGWPDAPCAYIQFSSSYDENADRARQAGWPYRRFDADHFHMLVDPTAVVDVLLELVKHMHVVPNP